MLICSFRPLTSSLKRRLRAYTGRWRRLRVEERPTACEGSCQLAFSPHFMGDAFHVYMYIETYAVYIYIYRVRIYIYRERDRYTHTYMCITCTVRICIYICIYIYTHTCLGFDFTEAPWHCVYTRLAEARGPAPSPPGHGQSFAIRFLAYLETPM